MVTSSLVAIFANRVGDIVANVYLRFLWDFAGMFSLTLGGMFHFQFPHAWDFAGMFSPTLGGMFISQFPLHGTSQAFMFSLTLGGMFIFQFPLKFKYGVNMSQDGLLFITTKWVHNRKQIDVAYLVESLGTVFDVDDPLPFKVVVETRILRHNICIALQQGCMNSTSIVVEVILFSIYCCYFYYY